MRVPPERIINSQLFVRSNLPVNPVSAVANNYRGTSFDAITPQSYNYGPVAQLINSRYLFELRKDIRRILKGRKLKEFLDYDYSEAEFDELPVSLRNLIAFDRSISSAEILQFIEEIDHNHEITFRDYNFDRIKFRALFQAIGELVDVEMQAGASTFVSLAESFEIKKKIKEVFVDLKDKIKTRIRFKKSKINSSSEQVWREIVDQNGNN